jgi:hypothetical protein
MSLRPGPPLDDSRASHDARVRWLLRALPGAVVVAGPPAPLPRPARPSQQQPEDYSKRAYPPHPVRRAPRPSVR